MNIIRKYVENIHVSLKSDNNNGYLREDQCTLLIIFRSLLPIMRNVLDEICTKNQNTFYVQKHSFFKNLTVYEIMWKNIVEPGSPQMAIEYSVCALHAGYLKLPTYTQIMYYLLLFHCATMIVRKRISVTLYVRYIVCLVLVFLGTPCLLLRPY